VFNSIAEEISLRLVADKLIPIDKMKYYTYGIELVLNNFIIFLSITVISILTDNVSISLAYVLTYCPIRNYVGGYHCKTYAKCYFTTLTLYILMLIFDTYLSGNRLMVSCILLVITTPIILVLTPVDYGNGTVNNDDRKKYRQKSAMLIVIALLGYIFSIVIHQQKVAFAISWGIFMVFLLMMRSLLSNLSEMR
jgi:accessory gene regulator B